MASVSHIYFVGFVYPNILNLLGKFKSGLILKAPCSKVFGKCVSRKSRCNSKKSRCVYESDDAIPKSDDANPESDNAVSK